MISPNPQIFQSLLTYQAFPTKKWLDVLIDRAHVSQGKCFQPICSETVTQLKSQQILFLSHLTMPSHLRFRLLTISAVLLVGLWSSGEYTKTLPDNHCLFWSVFKDFSDFSNQLSKLCLIADYWTSTENKTMGGVSSYASSVKNFNCILQFQTTLKTNHSTWLLVSLNPKMHFYSNSHKSILR